MNLQRPKIIATKDAPYQDMVRRDYGLEKHIYREDLSVERFINLDGLNAFFFVDSPGKKKKRTRIVGVVFMEVLKDLMNDCARLVSSKEVQGRSIFLDESKESSEVLKRLLHAHKIGAANQLIAKVFVRGNEEGEGLIRVTACDFTEIEINQKDITALSKLTLEDLRNFEIDKYGADISWKDETIHLNLESFKVITDQKMLKAKLKESKLEAKNFGKLMKVFRVKYKIKQSDFGKLNERQIRKYENGECYPSFRNLETISSKFGLSVNDYLNAVASRKE